MDLYATLGVKRDATTDEIRSAYRKLARRYHPDVNPGSAAAEAKFKEVAAAHDVLSDPEKRKLYDEFGENGLQGGFDPEQARAYQRWSASRAHAPPPRPEPDFDLDDLFGGPAGPARGPDAVGEVELDFADALRGVEVSLRVPVPSPCARCDGSGEQAGASPQPCARCGGQGRVPAVRGPVRLLVSCNDCGGTGMQRPPCPDCGGRGSQPGESTLRVRIPPGADDGSQITLRGQGAPGRRGGPPGDVVIRTRVRPHPHFRREGLDLVLELPVTLAEAYEGASVDVPTPDGTVKLKVPPRAQPGTRLRLRGRGVRRGKEVGDLYAVVSPRLPPLHDEALARALREAAALYAAPLREDIRL